MAECFGPVRHRRRIRLRFTVLAVAFSTISVLACGSDTPTGNGPPAVAHVFTVSGSVVDDVGEGVAGVSIDFASFGTATTGLDGTWSKSGLEGRVTITPTKANWGFSPGSVDVEAETTGLTFIGSALSTLLEIVVQWDRFGVSGSNSSSTTAFANEVVEPTHFGTRLEYLDENAFFAQSLTRDVAEEFGLITLEVPAAARTRLFVTAVRLNDGGAGQPGQRDPIVWFGEVPALEIVAGVSTTVHMGDVVWTAPSWDFEDDAVRAAYEIGTMVGDRTATLGLDFFITVRDPFGDRPWDEFIGLNGIGGGVADSENGFWSVRVFCRNDLVGQEQESTCRFWPYLKSTKFNLPDTRASVPPLTKTFVVEWR